MKGITHMHVRTLHSTQQIDALPLSSSTREAFSPLVGASSLGMQKRKQVHNKRKGERENDAIIK